MSETSEASKQSKASKQNTVEPKPEPKVIATGSKVKDPRRVAAGKRLAAISKKAKEAKANRLKQQSESYSSESNDNTMYVVGGLVVVGVVYYLLLTNKGKIVRTLSRDKKQTEPTTLNEPPEQEKSKRIFDD